MKAIPMFQVCPRHNLLDDCDDCGDPYALSRSHISKFHPVLSPPVLIREGTFRRDGSIVRFTHDLLKSYGIEWVQNPISEASYAAFPESVFTACIFDVALNVSDICVGSTWRTESRSRLVPFTRSLQTIEFKVVAFRDLSSNNGMPSFASLMLQPFQPFENEMCAFNMKCMSMIVSLLCGACAQLTD